MNAVTTQRTLKWHPPLPKATASRMDDLFTAHYENCLEAARANDMVSALGSACTLNQTAEAIWALARLGTPRAQALWAEWCGPLNLLELRLTIIRTDAARRSRRLVAGICEVALICARAPQEGGAQ